MVYRKNDEAVSPVIGVILMVAITVILAAVIAAFVFGMSGNISKTKTVAITVQKVDAGTISVMNNGGQDATSLNNLSVTTVPPMTSCTGPTGFVNGPPACSYASNPVIVGTTMRLINNTATIGFGGKTEVIAVGTFSDGSNQVLLDTFV